MPRTRLISLLSLIIIFAIALWFFRPRESFINHQCGLTQNDCTVMNEQVRIHLRASPRPFDASNMVEMDLKVNFKDKDEKIKDVKVFFIGMSMKIPNGEYILREKEDSFYYSKIILPFCSEKIMNWRVHLVIQTNQKSYKSNFDFEAKRL
jgi:hypothetical protein